MGLLSDFEEEIKDNLGIDKENKTFKELSQSQYNEVIEIASKYITHKSSYIS